MTTLANTLNLPAHFKLEPELLEHFSNRPGHQRCVEGRDELLLVLHEVPRPGIPERDAVFFWKRMGGRWHQPGGTGLSELTDLLDRYAKAIDRNEEKLDKAVTAADIFGILRHSGPLARSTRNLALALEQALVAAHDDREIRTCRDRARELERAAELLHGDARIALEFWRAERAEEHARSSARLSRIAFRMNLLAGFFLPMMALSGLLGMNVKIPDGAQPYFWGVVAAGLVIGAVLLLVLAHNTGRNADFGTEEADD